VIRFFLSFRHSKQLQSQKNAIYFLDFAAEQRITSPLLLSFDCMRDAVDSRGMPRAAETHHPEIRTRY